MHELVLARGQLPVVVTSLVRLQRLQLQSPPDHLGEHGLVFEVADDVLDGDLCGLIHQG